MKPETAATMKVWTPSTIAKAVKELAETQIGRVWIEGEISNYRKIQRSGHAYCSLKDVDSQIKVAIFAGVGARVKFEVKDGQKVLILGKVTVYEPQGEYQLVAEHLEPKGLGAAQLALMQLKEKLEKEGLFDPARKKRIPFLPRRVALVTSPTSAAVKDMLTVIERRFTSMDVWIFPVPVQGAEAAPAMVKAMEWLSKRDDVDVIMIGRGGGSAEDLWAFNDEALARAIAACPIPVISAIGHEIDVTLADLVSDKRAQTPSEAAELAVPVLAELEDELKDLEARMKQALVDDIELLRQRVDGLTPRLDGSLRGLTERLGSRLDVLRPRLGAALRRRVDLARHRVASHEPRLAPALRVLVGRKREKIASAAGRLEALSPLNVLARGYSMTRHGKTGEVLRKASQVAPGDLVRTTLERAELVSKVTEVRPTPPRGAKT